MPDTVDRAPFCAKKLEACKGGCLGKNLCVWYTFDWSDMLALGTLPLMFTSGKTQALGLGELAQGEYRYSLE
jgi:hypothetical protein